MAVELKDGETLYDINMVEAEFIEMDVETTPDSKANFIDHMIWTTEATKLFLSLYKDGREQLLSGDLTHKKDLWYFISNEMTERGYTLSPAQAENRLKTIERAYRNSILDIKAANAPLICGFESELEELFGQKYRNNAVDPLAIVESKETMMWTDVETKLFLSLYKDTSEMLNSGRLRCKKNVWSLIAKKMQEQGHPISALQAENKCKTLERAYKKCAMGKRTGRTRSSILGYQKELEEIFGPKYNISSRSRRSMKKDVSHIPSRSPSPAPPAPSPPPPAPSPPIPETPESKSIKNRDGKTAQALKMVRDSILNLTRKMDEQLENQRRFLTAQDNFHKSVLEQQRKMYLERRRKNDLLEEFLRRKYE